MLFWKLMIHWKHNTYTVLSVSLSLSKFVELCKSRCFPPVVLAWDSASDLRVIPNVYSETIVVDSSPALWGLAKGSEKTNVLLLVSTPSSFQLMYFLLGIPIKNTVSTIQKSMWCWYKMLSMVLYLIRYFIPAKDANYSLQADPHCSYRVGVSVSISAAASRFLLLYSSQVIILFIYLFFE